MEYFLVRGVGASVETKVDMKKYLKAVWEFCSYLFVPQRRPIERSDIE